MEHDRWWQLAKMAMKIIISIPMHIHKNNYRASFEGIIPIHQTHHVNRVSLDCFLWRFLNFKVWENDFVCVRMNTWWKTLKNFNVIIIMIIYFSSDGIATGHHTHRKIKRMTATIYASKNLIACCKLSKM